MEKRTDYKTIIIGTVMIMFWIAIFGFIVWLTGPNSFDGHNCSICKYDNLPHQCRTTWCSLLPSYGEQP